MHELNLSCTQSELKVFNPPPGATCAAYLQPLQAAGAPGYTVNPNATSACAYCPISQGDAFMSYQLGWSYNDIGLCFGVLAALYAINRITLVLFMWMKSRSHVAAGKK